MAEDLDRWDREYLLGREGQWLKVSDFGPPMCDRSWMRPGVVIRT